MEKNKLKVCIIIASDPNFLGGLGTYQRNLIPYLKKSAEVSMIYKGAKRIRYTKEGVNFFQIKSPNSSFLGNIFFDLKVNSFLKENRFNIINSQGLTGIWMSLNSHKGDKNTKLVHTYHGSTYHFYKNHLRRFSKIKRILFFPILFFPYLIERFPMKNADKIICVSNHVKKDLMKLHGIRGNMEVIKTGVDLVKFKPRDKIKTRLKLNLEKNTIYGLYVGRGGFWTKGLDKVVNLSKEIYKLNKNFRLIIVGAEEKKIAHLLDNNFMILLPPQTRDNMPYYYNAADIFFSMSRCEGGAPSMVTSEAMASGCLIITDKEAEQEIIEDEKNGLIIDKDYEKEAKRILNKLKYKESTRKIINNSLKSAKELSLDKWAEKYLNALMN
jgi:glycosyltransferase involved in cell wall biosynthesis